MSTLPRESFSFAPTQSNSKTGQNELIESARDVDHAYEWPLFWNSLKKLQLTQNMRVLATSENRGWASYIGQMSYVREMRDWI